MDAALMTWNGWLVSELPFLKHSGVKLPEWVNDTKLKFQADTTHTTDIDFLKNWKQTHGILRIAENKTRPDRFSVQYSGSSLTVATVHFVTLAIKWYTRSLSGETKHDNLDSSNPRKFFSQRSMMYTSDRLSLEVLGNKRKRVPVVARKENASPLPTVDATSNPAGALFGALAPLVTIHMGRATSDAFPPQFARLSGYSTLINKQ